MCVYQDKRLNDDDCQKKNHQNFRSFLFYFQALYLFILPRFYVNIILYMLKQDKTRQLQEALLSVEGSIVDDHTNDHTTFDTNHTTNGVSLDALFIGPKGQNMEHLVQLLKAGLKENEHYRKQYPIDEPCHLTKKMMDETNFVESLQNTRKIHEELLRDLSSVSTPFHSSRYYGHMNWDVSIPSLAGLISSVLYNQNNATFESSPLTTKLEIFCVQKLVQMIGYPTFLNETHETLDIKKIKETYSWGHLTSGGTVSNIEGIWAARSVKYLAFTIRFYVQSLKDTLEDKANMIFVVLADGRKKMLLQASVWELFNIPSEKVMNLFEETFRILFDNDLNAYPLFQKQIRPFTFGSLGFIQFQEKIEELLEENPNEKWPKNRMPKIKSFMSYKGHYSFSKAFGLLGLGEKNIQKIEIDADCRLDVQKLEEKLNEYAEKNIPILAVIAIAGSTESSSFDNVYEIHRIQQRMKLRGLYFHFHVDGAYGAYFSSMLRKRSNQSCSFNSYVQRQLQSLHFADSLSINPHKTGYVPYACSCIIYRDYRLRNNLNYSAPYIFKQVEPNVAIYGVEGSKAGCMAASLYMALKTLPLERSQHGELLERTLLNTKIFSASLYCIEEICDLYLQEEKFKHRFSCLPFNMSHSERFGTGEMDKQIQAFRIFSSTSPNDLVRLVNDRQIKKYYDNLGPDLNIVCFSINFKDPYTNKWNRSLKKINKLTKVLTEKTRIHPSDKDYRQKNLYLSNTTINESVGKFFDSFISRNNLDKDTNEIEFIRSTIMNPSFTTMNKNEEISPNFLFVKQLSKLVNETIDELHENLFD